MNWKITKNEILLYVNEMIKSHSPVLRQRYKNKLISLGLTENDISLIAGRLQKC